MVTHCGTYNIFGHGHHLQTRNTNYLHYLVLKYEFRGYPPVADASKEEVSAKSWTLRALTDLC